MSIKVYFKNHEHPEQILRRFKKAVLREGIMRECSEREYYEKPSDVRRKNKKRKIKNIYRSKAEQSSF